MLQVGVLPKQKEPYKTANFSESQGPQRVTMLLNLFGEQGEARWGPLHPWYALGRSRRWFRFFSGNLSSREIADFDDATAL